MTPNSQRIAALALLAGACPAIGQTLSWANAAGGSTGATANWNPAQLPTASSTLVFNLAASYPVTFVASTPQSSAMNFNRGTLTFTMSSPHSTGTTTLGLVNGNSPTLTLTTGTLNTNDIILGSVFGSAGTLNINDDDAILNCDALEIANNTNLTCTVNVTNGGTINSSSSVIGQINPIGHGIANVSGQLTQPPFKRSTWAITNSLTVGDSGIGDLNVSNSGLVSTTTDLFIGLRQSAGPTLSDGTVTVGGSAFISPATINVGRNLRIGRGTLSSTNTGNGLLTINNNGVVSVTGSTIVGSSGTGSGTLEVGTGGRFTSAGLTFGNSGSLNHTGGIITVTAGSFVPPNPSQHVISGASDTELVLDGAVTSAITPPTTSSDAIIIGNAGEGTLSLRNGAQLTTANGRIVLGAQNSARGTLNVTGGASIDMTAGLSSRISVGDLGVGSLTITSGGIVETNIVDMESRATGICSVLVDGPGTVLRTGSLNIGPSGSADNRVTLSNGATLDQSNPVAGHSLVVNTRGRLDILNSTVMTPNEVVVRGPFTMTDGIINASSFFVDGNASASGTINAKIKQTSPATLTATGPLTVGDGSVDGYNLVPLAVGAHTVTLRDADEAHLTGVTIGGGTLTGSAAGIELGFTLSGTGTIDVPLFNRGNIVATGAQGLTFRKDLTGGGTGITGTLVTLTNRADFIGSGTLTAKFRVDPGSTLTVVSVQTTLGDGSTAGFVCDGNLVVDMFQPLDIDDSNGTSIGGSTTIRSGTINCPVTFTARGGLLGNGAINSGLINIQSQISPGIGQFGIGTIVLTGTVNIVSGHAAGSLVSDIVGSQLSEADKVLIHGDGNLGGPFTLRTPGNFAPPNGLRRTVIESTFPHHLNGTFSSVSLPARWHTIQSSSRFDVQYCSADFNSDGFVDGFDYDDFVACFEGDACPSGETADFNSDGFADGFDYDDFIIAFEEGC